MTGPSQFVFIIGAPKSGTTSLANWLNARPDMAYCAGKEPKFFTDFGATHWQGPGVGGFTGTMVTEEAAYLAGFPDDPAIRWAIDGSTDYLWCAAAPDRIRAWSERYPSKLICILRDPVERAISEYQHTVRDNLEPLSFLGSLEAEESRFAQNWQPLFYHRRRSLYHAAVSRYAALFGADLLVMDYRELRDPAASLARVEAFLGVPAHRTADNERQNASYVYRNRAVGQILNNRTLRRAARLVTPGRLRRQVKGGLLSVFATRYDPAEADYRQMAALLRDEIAACRASPLIPTGNWKSWD